MAKITAAQECPELEVPQLVGYSSPGSIALVLDSILTTPLTLQDALAKTLIRTTRWPRHKVLGVSGRLS